MLDKIRALVARAIAPKAAPGTLAERIEDFAVEFEEGVRQMARDSESSAFRDKYMTAADLVAEFHAGLSAIVKDPA